MRRAASGWASDRALLAIARSWSGCDSKSLRVPRNCSRGQIGFQQNARGSRLRHHFGIPALMIVRGLGKGDEHGGFSRGGQLGHGGRATAGKHQVRGCKSARHVVEKGLHLPAIRRRSTVFVGSLRGLGVACARLMQDGESRNRLEQGRLRSSP